MAGKTSESSFSEEDNASNYKILIKPEPLLLGNAAIPGPSRLAARYQMDINIPETDHLGIRTDLNKLSIREYKETKKILKEYKQNFVMRLPETSSSNEDSQVQQSEQQAENCEPTRVEETQDTQTKSKKKRNRKKRRQKGQDNQESQPSTSKPEHQEATPLVVTSCYCSRKKNLCSVESLTVVKPVVEPTSSQNTTRDDEDSDTSVDEDLATYTSLTHISKLQLLFFDFDNFVRNNPCNKVGIFAKIQNYLSALQKLGLRLLKCVLCLCTILERVVLLYINFRTECQGKDRDSVCVLVRQLLYDIDTVTMESVFAENYDYDLVDIKTHLYKYIYDSIVCVLENLKNKIIMDIYASTQLMYPENMITFKANLGKVARFIREIRNKRKD